MKKKIVIATINDYILYQPTILNLYDFLIESFDVTIVSFEPYYLSKEKEKKRKVVYLKVNPFWKEIANKVDFLVHKVITPLKKIIPGLTYHYIYYNKCLPNALKKGLKKLQGDIIIAVDIPALYIAQQVYGKVHFLSLEIDKRDPFYKKIDTKKISSVFIQSETRYKHLFPDVDIPRFFVQNAPVFTHPIDKDIQRADFVWAGTIWERFGVMDCIEFFNKYPQNRLVLKGGTDRPTLKKINFMYKRLIEKDVIHFNNEYLPGDQFIHFLSGFKIGFCFYSWDLINASFNYRTAPSGKLFMYMASGVPVIACNIPGFDFIEEFGAGILIKDYNPQTIKEAVDRIEKNYQEFSESCYRVAEHFSFDKNVAPYIDFLNKFKNS